MGNGGIGPFGGSADPTANPNADTAHRNVIEQYYAQVYNAASDAAAQNAVANFVTPGIKIHRDGQVRKGVVLLRQHVAATRANFPDIHVDLREMVAAGNRVAYRMNVTFRDPASPVGTPRNRRVRGIAITRFLNQRMAETWVHYEQEENI